MKLTKETLESKSQGSKLTPEDLVQILQNQVDAEKYLQLQEKLKELENDTQLMDRLQACDYSDAAEILRSFIFSK